VQALDGFLRALERSLRARAPAAAGSLPRCSALSYARFTADGTLAEFEEAWRRVNGGMTRDAMARKTENFRQRRVASRAPALSPAYHRRDT